MVMYVPGVTFKPSSWPGRRNTLDWSKGGRRNSVTVHNVTPLTLSNEVAPLAFPPDQPGWYLVYDPQAEWQHTLAVDRPVVMLVYVDVVPRKFLPSWVTETGAQLGIVTHVTNDLEPGRCVWLRKIENIDVVAQKALQLVGREAFA